MEAKGRGRTEFIPEGWWVINFWQRSQPTFDPATIQRRSWAGGNEQLGELSRAKKP